MLKAQAEKQKLGKQKADTPKAKNRKQKAESRNETADYGLWDAGKG